MKTLLTILLVALAATALANPIAICGFDDPGGLTLLGMSGEGDPPVLATIEPGDDGYALRIVNNSPEPGARAYIGAIRSLYTTLDACEFMLNVRVISDSPDLGARLHLRYCNSLPGDFDHDDGTAATYPLPLSDWTPMTWNVDIADPYIMGVVLEVEFLTAGAGEVWVDDLLVMAEPAELFTPCFSVVGREATSLTSVKSLFH